MSEVALSNRIAHSTCTQAAIGRDHLEYESVAAADCIVSPPYRGTDMDRPSCNLGRS